MIKQLVKDWVTEKDGVSFCPVRIAFIAGIVGYFAFTLYDFADTKFIEHAKDWISGLAEFIGLGGAAVAGKNFTEAPE